MDRGLFAHADAPERVAHRYHLIRVVFTLTTVGLVSLVVGLATLLDPENAHPLRYAGGSALIAIICALAVFYLRRPGERSTSSVEAALLTGLFATVANTIYGGVLGVDSWWQVCGYLVVILIGGGVSIRRWSSFWFFIAASLIAWTIAITTADESAEFLFESYILIALGSLVAAAILWLFRIERKRVSELIAELRENAVHDPLTGILNRQGLLSATLGVGGMPPEWCGYLDVDFFKSINDRRGHDHGDEVLRAVARALVHAGGEVVARWGGDEFVLLGSGVPPEEQEIQDRVSRGVQQVEPGASVTVGIASGRRVRTKEELDRLMRDADRRMYQRRAEARGERSPATA